MAFLIRSLFLITLLVGSAQATLIQNSGFDQCADPLASSCLDQFEIFSTETNAGNQSFSVIDSGSNAGVFFNAGRLTPPNIFTDTSAQGGGIRQSFDFTGGDLSIGVFYNTLFNSGGTSTRGSIQASLFGPGTVIPILSDVFNFFSETASSDTSAQGSLNLNSTSDLAAGLYTLQISFTRAFQINDSISFGLTGISATSTSGGPGGGSNPVPEPGTVALLFAAVVGITATRKSKQAL